MKKPTSITITSNDQQLKPEEGEVNNMASHNITSPSTTTDAAAAATTRSSRSSSRDNGSYTSDTSQTNDDMATTMSGEVEQATDMQSPKTETQPQPQPQKLHEKSQRSSEGEEKNKTLTFYDKNGTSTGAPVPTAAPTAAASSSSRGSGGKEQKKKKKQKNRVFHTWDALMEKLRNSVTYVVLKMTHSAASHPWWWVIGILLISFGLLGIGFATNFDYNVAPDESLTPKDSVIREQKQWILEESGFPPQPLSLRALLHNEGANVVSQEGVDRMFQVLDAVQEKDNYQQLCDTALEENEYGFGGICHIRGISLFWNHSRDIMEEDVASDVDVVLAFNRDKYPDGSGVDRRELMGRMTYFNDLAIGAESFLLEIVIPATAPNAEAVAESVLDTLVDLRQKWTEDKTNVYQSQNNQTTTSFHLEVYLTDFSLESETLRAVFKDLPLIPSVFVIMAFFTCLIFSTSHKPGDTQVKQRILLGIGAVVAVVLSLAASYGLLYTIGESILLS